MADDRERDRCIKIRHPFLNRLGVRKPWLACAILLDSVLSYGNGDNSDRFKVVVVM